MALKVIVGQIIMNEVFDYKVPTGEKTGSVKHGHKKWRVLVMDKLATSILSACHKLNDILEKNVALIEDILKERDPLPLMDVVYFITPSEESVCALIKDFEHPSHPFYHDAYVFFTSAIPNEIFQMLRKANVRKHMKACTEINIAFIPYEGQVFSLDSRDTFGCLYSPTRSSALDGKMERVADQVATLCATLGEYPTIRYRSDWNANNELAQLLQQKLDAYKADDSTMGESPEKARSQLLIVDRGFDCVTPLLHELTFQAMAYDLLPIKNDVYKFFPEPNNNEKSELLNENDDLWIEFRHKHIAVASKQINLKLKKFIETKHMIHSDKQVMRNLPQVIRKTPLYQKELSKFAKHLHLAEDCMNVSKLKKIKKLCNVEQNLVIGKDAKGEEIKDHMGNIAPILENESISNNDKVRIIALYVMIKNGISENNLKKLFEKAGIDQKEQDMVLNISKLGINIVIEPPLGRQENLKKIYTVPRKQRITEDTYLMSRWTPILKDILEYCIENKLDSKYFPFLAGRSKKIFHEVATSARYEHKDRLQTAIKNVPRFIVFIVGGASLSEIRCAYEIQKQTNDWEIFIGSTHILTPEIFLEDLSMLPKKD